MDKKLLVLALTVSLDAATTSIGLLLGLREVGFLASRLIPLLGPFYFAIEYLLLLGLAIVLSTIGRLLGARSYDSVAWLVVSAAPLLASLNNIYWILGG